MGQVKLSKSGACCVDLLLRSLSPANPNTHISYPFWPIRCTIINLNIMFWFFLCFGKGCSSVYMWQSNEHNLFLQNVSSPAKESRRLEHKTEDFACSLAPNPWLDESDDCRKLRIDKYDTKTQVWKLEISTNPQTLFSLQKSWNSYIPLHLSFKTYYLHLNHCTRWL
jgi:hypothetical protein